MTPEARDATQSLSLLKAGLAPAHCACLAQKTFSNRQVLQEVPRPVK
jgi:hypothetical protein